MLPRERYVDRAPDYTYAPPVTRKPTTVTPQPILPEPPKPPPLPPTPTPAQSLLAKGTGAKTKPKGVSSGFYSPELDKLKHSFLNQDWFSKSDLPVGSTDRERQGVYNLARRQQQGALDTAMESMRETLGSAGWKPGESGIADSILARMSMEGAESMGQKAQEIALNERNKRFEEGMALKNFDLSKMGVGLGALESAGGLEQFMKQLQQQQGQFGASQGLANRKFKYGQEQDALNMLMSLAGYGQQNQSTAWQPYWGSIAGM